MNIPRVIAAGALSTVFAASAVAAVSPEEAKKLGGELTLFGSIKAGNADGSIPAYTGGLATPPAGYDPNSGKYVDPFASEKPLYRITAQNMDKYADKLSEGVKHLLQINPDYYIDVWPTHRTAAYPQNVLEATVRNATTCKTIRDQLGVDKGCRGGLPFPIPKTGYEVMWNKVLAYNGPGAWQTYGTRSYIIPTNGVPVLTSIMENYTEKPYYQVDRSDRSDNMLVRLSSKTSAPARKAGEASGYADFLDPAENPRKAWSYAPGQRRIKMAPEFSYDTPVSTIGGAASFDELFLFTGLMDRFDFKLVGKKEMYIPYNNYKLQHCKLDQWAMPKHMNPDCERWELHRVWVVEATLKPGKRHINSKRMYYFQEDDYVGGIMEGWDQAGKLYRTGIAYAYTAYEVPAPYGPAFAFYDFNKGIYARMVDLSEPDSKAFHIPARPERDLNPEAVAGAGIR